MSAVTRDPRLERHPDAGIRHQGAMGEPPLRRIASPAWHPAVTEPGAGTRLQPDPGMPLAGGTSAAVAARMGDGRGPVPQPELPRAHAFIPPAATGSAAPEPLLDSLPAISSAVYSWPDEAPARHERAPAGQPATQHAAQPTRVVRRARRDPSPSRLAYRLHRLWLTPFFRRGVTVGLPVFLIVLTVGLWLGDDARRAQAVGFVSDLRAGFENRPEFRVNTLSVHAETPEVAQAIALRLGLEFPVSSFHLDLPELRRATEALDAVETAALRIRSGGVLEISVIEREPAMVWRHYSGLDLVDIEGRRIARLAEREARADLPLIAGEGAPDAIAEAQQLLAAASPLRERLRGLVRVSERRWDVVLDRGQRILLPAQGALPALERALALDGAQDLLARDVSVVDLRDASRPTIRLSQPAVSELHRIRNQVSGVPNR